MNPILSSSDIACRLSNAKCCLAQLQYDVIEKEKKGFNCKGDQEKINQGWLIIAAIEGYVPEGEVQYTYTTGCTLDFTDKTLVQYNEIQYNAGNPTLYTMWNASAMGIGGTFAFSDTFVVITQPTGAVAVYSYTYDPITHVLTIAGYPIDVTYDPQLENITFSFGGEVIVNFQWLTPPLLDNCTIHYITAPKPCLTNNEVASLLNKLEAGCVECGDEDTTPEIDLFDVNIVCGWSGRDATTSLQVNFNYFSLPVPNSLSLIFQDVNTLVEDTIKTWADTGSTNGTINETIAVDAIANGTYNVYIKNSDGTISNILTDYVYTACTNPNPELIDILDFSFFCRDQLHNIFVDFDYTNAWGDLTLIFQNQNTGNIIEVYTWNLSFGDTGNINDTINEVDFLNPITPFGFYTVWIQDQFGYQSNPITDFSYTSCQT